ncbi:U-box domain-containing protein 43 isoform X2 [Elaeis guineensis]|uniref:RING-type E3 ubiquitin transferase n=1 Tax=Elaeis guineensis var. tenera TaxID=51953 RepID=A0A8N4IDW8_ELAGV|nr:U-box domain-containing protein 43 isoform X2 [Elaeis guineensis]
MTSPAASPAAALDSVTRTLSEILGRAGGGGDDFLWDPPRRFASFAQRLQLVAHHLSRSPPEILSASPAVHTALRGVAGDLEASCAAFSTYRSRCRIYVLINCKPLCSSLRDRVSSIASWLALLDSPLSPIPDLRKKAADLSRDMQQADLRVTENEERVYTTLQKEAEVRESSKAVQSAIMMDLARALGMDFTDHGKLAEQIKLLRSDLSGSSTVAERRILMSLEKIFDSWSVEPCIADGSNAADFEDDAHIPPFRNFLCPLTKEVMKDPVVVESSQTYERTAIRYWFDRCLEDGRDPTCPVTGQVLSSLELKPNIGLAGAIEEWVNRNVEIHIKSALQYLGEGSSCPLECLESVLDNVYRISEEHPSSRYRVRNAGIVGLVVRMLNERSKRMGSQLRGKALMAMHSMTKDDESKLIMIEEGITRLAIRSLTGHSEMEKEYALRLLLEFSCDEGYCKKIALEKGALVLLSSMAGSSEYPTLSNLAEEVLKNIERVEENIQHLAIAGRFQPLITQLCKGSEDVRMEIALLVGKITLTSNGKGFIARQGGKVLVDMLSSREERASSLQQDDPSDLKDLAASIIANIVANSGHWELSLADKEGHRMQSEFIIHRLLDLLSCSSCKCQASVLQILCGIASSPQASDMAATYIRSGNGTVIIAPYLEHSEIGHRMYAFRLVRILSQRLGEVLAGELRASDKLPLLKGKLLDNECSFGEKCEIACLLANLPISNEEVKTILGPDLLKWIVSNIKEQQSSVSGKNKNARSMVEGLVGLLLHYARSSDPAILALAQENHFMTIFREQLNSRSHNRAKERAALGLKYLSESARALIATADSEPQPPRGFCAPLVLICGKPPKDPVSCPLHGVVCEDDSSFCLLKGNAIKPLIDLMNDEYTDVQIAAVEALSTIVSDAQNLKSATNELEQLGFFDAAIYLFKEVAPGELQEKVISMVERFLQVESLVQLYSTDQALVNALVEALKQGTPRTKRHAQNVLTNLRQLSGVGGRNSNPTPGRRTYRLSD